MTEGLKKQLLERILFLNEKTNAVKDTPHRITIEELNYREKRAKSYMLGIAILLMTILVLSFVIVIGTLTESAWIATFSSNLEGTKYIWVALCVYLMSMMNRFYLRLTLIREQIFLTGLVYQLELTEQE